MAEELEKEDDGFLTENHVIRAQRGHWSANRNIGDYGAPIAGG